MKHRLIFWVKHLSLSLHECHCKNKACFLTDLYQIKSPLNFWFLKKSPSPSTSGPDRMYNIRLRSNMRTRGRLGCAHIYTRGGLGGKSGPGVTVRPAHLIHGALPTQYTTRCPLKALHVSTSQWPTWKNTHTLNITLDDYKEITSYMFFL